jgi:serine/threonine protein kinase
VPIEPDCSLLAATARHMLLSIPFDMRPLTSNLVNAMFSRLQGQPESYERKSKYRFGRTLGAGTYGIVREADSPNGKVAIKIILKKNVKGNERMVLDELDMLQRLKHPHIVRFVDWFESRVRHDCNGGEGCSQPANTALNRTSTILSPSSLPAESYLTGSASRENSPRRTLHRPSSRCWAPLTICTTIMLSTEVREC